MPRDADTEAHISQKYERIWATVSVFYLIVRSQFCFLVHSKVTVAHLLKGTSEDHGW